MKKAIPTVATSMTAMALIGFFFFFLTNFLEHN